MEDKYAKSNFMEQENLYEFPKQRLYQDVNPDTVILRHVFRTSKLTSTP